MDSSPEEFKIPLLDDLRTRPKIRNRPEIRNRNRSPWEYIGFAASIAIVIGMSIWIIILAVTQDEKEMKLNKLPEIQLKSLIVCPTTISESVIWDLKFDISNPYNDSDICIFDGFEVSIFPYNQTKLLTKADVTPTTTCVGPRNHTLVIAFAEASSTSIQDLNDYLDPSGTIRLDLIAFGAFSYGDLVCGDAKVALSSNSSSSSSSCASMVGDPFECSYRGTIRWDHSGSLFLIIGFLVIFCALFFNMLWLVFRSL